MLGKTLKNSIWNVISFIIILLVAFISTPIELSLLGTSKYGLLVILTSVLSPLGLATLNFGQATIKYIAEAHANNDYELAGIYLRTTLTFNLLIGFLGTIIIFLLSPWLIHSVFSISPSDQNLAIIAMRILSIGWMAGQVYSTFNVVPSAFQQYEITSIGNILFFVFSTVLGLVVLWWTRNLISFSISNLLSQVVFIVYWIFISRKLMPRISLLPDWNSVAFRKSFNYGIWQTVSQFGGIVQSQADKYVLGILLSTSVVAYYDVAMNVQKQAYSLGAKLGEVLFPTFSYESVANNREREASLLVRSTWFLSAASASIMIPLFVIGGDFLHLWVGNNVASQSAPVLKILSCAGLLGSASNVTFFYLQGIGKTRLNAYIVLASGTTVAIISLILVPRLGLFGAGWGNLAAMIVQALFVSIILRQHFKDFLSWGVMLSSLYGPAITGLLVGLLLSIFKANLSYQPSWITLIISGAFCSTTTLLLIFMVDFLLPGNNIRNKDVRRLVNLAIHSVYSFSRLR